MLITVNEMQGSFSRENGFLTVGDLPDAWMHKKAFKQY